MDKVNSSVADFKKAFARNSVLRLLNMSNNKIKRLGANSFRGMRHFLIKNKTHPFADGFS